jgi:hypothetical protein
MTGAGAAGMPAASRHGVRRRRRVADLWRPLLCGGLLLLPGPARAADPLLTVFKNTLLGGVTGLVLGSAVSLVTDEDHRSDVVRWGCVIGTLGGFAMGVTLAARGDEGLFEFAAGPGPRANRAGARAAAPTARRQAPPAGPASFTPMAPAAPGRPLAFGLRGPTHGAAPIRR